MGLLALLWNWRDRRRRRNQLGDFPEYREEDFDQPNLARANSINMRVGHLERLKKAAKTQLPVEDGTECIICMNEFVKDDELVQLECSDKHIYHFNCLQHWIKQGKRECPWCRTVIKCDSSEHNSL